MLCAYSAEMVLSTIIRFTRSVVMPSLGSPAVFTISDTKPDVPLSFPFFIIILLIDSLTIPFSFKEGAPITASPRGKLFVFHANSV